MMKLKKLSTLFRAGNVGILNPAIKLGILSLKFIMGTVLVRFCNPDIVGVYNYYSFLILFIVYLLGFEVYNYSLKNILKATSWNSRRSLINWQLSFSLISVTFGVVFVFLSFYFLSERLNFVPVIILGVYGEILFLDIYRIYNITGRQVLANILMLARTAFSISLIGLLIFFKISTSFNLLLVFFGSGFVFSLLSLFPLKYKFVRISPVKFVKIILSARDMYFSAAIQRAQQFFDKYLIFITLGAASVASYTFFLTGINASLTMLESGIFVFSLQYLHDKENFYKHPENLKKYAMKLFFKILLFSVFLTSAIALLLIGFSYFNGKASYIQDLYMIAPLCLTSVLSAISYPFHLTLYFMNRERLIFKSSLYSALGFFLCGVVFMFEKSSISLSAFVVSYAFIQLITKFIYARRDF